MPSWRRSWTIAAAITAVTGVFILAVMTRSMATAQGGGQAALPRVAGKPDFSGIWEANNTANWDLQTHEARPMVAQPGFVANSVVLAAPVLGLGSIGWVPGGQALWKATRSRTSHGPQLARKKTWNTGWTAIPRSSASSLVFPAPCTCRTRFKSSRARRKS